MRQPIDFSKVDVKYDEQGGDILNFQLDQIDPSEIHRAEPFFEFFTKDTVKNMFSKRWQNREEGYKKFKTEIENLFTSTPSDSKDSSNRDNEQEAKDESSGVSSNMVAFNKNKQECLKLVCNAAERGLNDKILQVRFKSLDLIKSFLNSEENNIELKELSNIVGILVDILSENNSKLSSKSNEILKLTLNRKDFDFNEGLLMIISKTSSKNKAFTRFNHSKLSFIVEALEEMDASLDENDSKNLKRTPFPVCFLLDFVEKMIVIREKIMSKEIRDKVEKAYIFCYQHSSFSEIKNYIDSLDNISQLNLSKHIPEIEVDKTQKELIVEEKQREEDTNKKLFELKKERLKSIKLRKSIKNHNDYQNIESAMSDVENVLNMVKEISSRERRNRVLSVDPESKEKHSKRDEEISLIKPNTRKNIKTNMELLKGSIKVNSSKASKDDSRNIPRTTTPMKSKEDSQNNQVLKENKKSERSIKRHSKARNYIEREEVKEESKFEPTNRSAVIKSSKEAEIKCTECGDEGFKNIKELTLHQHKYCKAYRRCTNCEKLLKASEFDLHISKKCKKKTTIKNTDNK